MDTNVFVFGEIHSNLEQRKKIEERIREIKPIALLHELLYQDICYKQFAIRRRLAESGPGKLCDPRINDDIYKLGLELKMMLIGIDKEVDPRVPHKQSFSIRENYMAERVAFLLDNCYPGKPVVIVVGDTHLREKESKELGPPSPFMEFLKSRNNIEIIRAPEDIQELP